MKLVSDGTTFRLMDGSRVAASGVLRCYHGHWTLREGHVAPAYRGRGFQRRLIRARVHSAASRGAERVLVWVNPTNHRSLNNLVAEGFRFMGPTQRMFEGKRHVGLHLWVA